MLMLMLSDNKSRIIIFSETNTIRKRRKHLPEDLDNLASKNRIRRQVNEKTNRGEDEEQKRGGLKKVIARIDVNTE